MLTHASGCRISGRTARAHLQLAPVQKTDTAIPATGGHGIPSAISLGCRVRGSWRQVIAEADNQIRVLTVPSPAPAHTPHKAITWIEFPYQ